MYFLVLLLLFSPFSLSFFRFAAAVIETACAAFDASPIPLMLPLPVKIRSPTSSHDSQSSKTSAGPVDSESAAKESNPKNASFACHDLDFLPAPARTGAAGATSAGSVKSKATRVPEPKSGEFGRCRAEQRARETVVGERSGEGARGAGARAGSAAMRRANAAATSSLAAEEEEDGCKSALVMTDGRCRGAGLWRCCR